jgi:hypothetical protein
MMSPEAANVYEAATDALSTILSGLLRWLDMLEGAERDEAAFHIAQMSEAYDRFTLAIADHEGVSI